MEGYRLLALSGSLRQRSYNTAAIKALRALAPDNVDIVIGRIGQLPLFNPDLEDDWIPALDDLKAQLAEASGLIIASPEYAHGISAPMKNALDWLVSGTEFPFKPVMLINTSPRAGHAQAALKEVITTMSGHLVEEAHVALPLLGSELDRRGIQADAALSGALLTGLKAFCAAIDAQPRDA
ncbi:NAD(P)H-dependent oxidoreductase [Marinobacter halodurans]|uniref:NAD(P)H-dependent oxidoreductase n=1 Tax=Marinobacter halodurans TaxID=2528979 RepID=A0ABY1ZIT5_9GAMM|nr:NAD(P)H-dependent oxidoreductase [Marinobacter halodurans]TBW49113.1 NAD(P)H-dependent oxidoreductase [Marinobacter halodurans]